MTRDELQRAVQQLRNDNQEDLADAIDGMMSMLVELALLLNSAQFTDARNDAIQRNAVEYLTEQLCASDVHADTVTGDALALQARVAELEEVLWAVASASRTLCEHNRAQDYCYAHAVAGRGDGIMNDDLGAAISKWHKENVARIVTNAGLREQIAALEAEHFAALAMLQRLYDNAELVHDRALFGNSDYAALEAFLYPDDPETSLYDKAEGQ